mgnify:CR=1 FL=1
MLCLHQNQIFRDAMKTFVIIICTILLLSGCALWKDNRFDINTADFSKAKNEDLCSVYGYRRYRSHEAREELLARNVFSDDVWTLIDDRAVIKGMSDCAVKAAFAFDVRRILSSSYEDGRKGKSYIYSCIDERVPLCPYTQVDMIDSIVVKVFERKKI